MTSSEIPSNFRTIITRYFKIFCVKSRKKSRIPKKYFEQFIKKKLFSFLKMNRKLRFAISMGDLNLELLFQLFLSIPVFSKIWNPLLCLQNNVKTFSWTVSGPPESPMQDDAPNSPWAPAQTIFGVINGSFCHKL